MSYLAERKHPRFDFSTFPLVLSLRWEEPLAEDKPVRIEGRNISRGGLKFQSNRRIALFSPLRLSLFSKGNGQELAALEAKVVRVEEVDTGLGERTYGIALEFTAGQDALASLLPDPDAPGAAPNDKPAT